MSIHRAFAETPKQTATRQVITVATDEIRECRLLSDVLDPSALLIQTSSSRPPSITRSFVLTYRIGRSLHAVLSLFMAAALTSSITDTS